MYEERFSVCQFFDDGSHEYVSRGVTVDEAVEAFSHYVGIGEWLGKITRVIISDSSDSIPLEWEYGKGLSFPRNEVAV
jgi:hypothetical protein